LPQSFLFVEHAAEYSWTNASALQLYENSSCPVWLLLHILLEMVVEKMTTLTLVFLLYDNEEIYYPNSQLATNPISILYCSPNMNVAVELIVDVST